MVKEESDSFQRTHISKITEEDFVEGKWPTVEQLRDPDFLDDFLRNMMILALENKISNATVKSIVLLSKAIKENVDINRLKKQVDEIKKADKEILKRKGTQAQTALSMFSKFKDDSLED